MAQFNFNPNAGNIAAYNKGYGMGCFSAGNSLLCEGKYDKAFSTFQEGTEYTAENWGGLGICYELGFGTDVDYYEAFECYSTGADEGDQACKMALQRINNNGYYSSKDKKRYLQNLKIICGYYSADAGVGFGGGSIGTFGSGSSSSSGSAYRTCSGCGGSGRCTGCSGSGRYWVDSGTYTGSGSRARVNCGSCGGSGRCGVCHGTGRL